jgi:hypothetical protein
LSCSISRKLSSHSFDGGLDNALISSDLELKCLVKEVDLANISILEKGLERSSAPEHVEANGHGDKVVTHPNSKN